ncbi:replicative DNA helicase [Pseudaminobacter salicylatoxidans]|uniref:DNA 5'-3' helicase n=1 Tax=Pseudaminobacter salicylatoxidans TaxID=93369 RepID=A0A316BPU8_PSESE|nr:DnaB-like helicase C-terminal domain-containing protein [Pseudaminobacter salicylatoxidans]PWJ75267.1 replicative DNA helicase [Pseudaminobacter salicylatoxidans]
MTFAQIPDDAFVPEIEQDVLGTLLFGGDFRKVMAYLREDHFIPDAHRLIYRAMRAAHEQFGTTNLAVVGRLLPADIDLKFNQDTGQPPMAYMASLARAVVNGPAGLERGARAVIQQWARLKAAEVGRNLRAAAHEATSDPKTIIQGVAADLDNIAAELRAGPRRKTMHNLDEATEAALHDVRDAMARGNGLTGHTWGLTDINAATGGIHPGEMVIVGARPSMGKTAFALSVALRTAGAGVGAGFLSLEMGAKKLAIRRLTDIAYDWKVEIPYTNLIKGTVTEAELSAIVQANQDADQLPLWIEEQSGLTISDIRVKVERMAEQAEARGVKLGVLIVDYLQLIKPSARYSGNRVGEVTEISWALRELGREFGLGIIALSQLSRQLESRDDKRPQLSDLRESGSIEQDADMVAFLFREAYYLEKAKGKDKDKEDDRLSRLIDVRHDLEFIIAKQRNGPTKTIKLFVDIACSAVRNAARL